MPKQYNNFHDLTFSVLEYQAGQDEGCKLRTVGNWYAMTGYGLGFPRGSKWKPIMDKTLHKLSYNGVLERLQKFWLKGNLWLI